MLRQFYSLALEEGEGLGTAYEYISKLKLLKPYLNSQKILIYGLPEKYGWSLDFLYILSKHNCKVHVYDERKEKIRQYSKIVDTLLKKGIIQRKPKIVKDIKEVYDAIFSSEVIQRLDKNMLQCYFDDIKKFSKKSLIFFPNACNKSHCFFSKLNSYRPENIAKFFEQTVKTGFVDMPPFPPGLSLKSNRKRENLKWLIPLFRAWLFAEKICPNQIKKRFSHIAYVQVGDKT